jgi:siroheme synthase
VGKRGGRPSIEQPSISALLVAHVAAGKRVARLKGGCPSVFSRVHQELAALRAAGCAWELVPGVSSALAAPLAAGFPLTDVGLSPAFAVVSGHDPAAVDWSAFDRIPTLVVLMAGATLPAIASSLLGRSWQNDTPVCVVRSAGTPEQAILRWTLGSIVADTTRPSLSPCVVIIGRVAGQDALSAAAAAAAAGGGEGG